MFDRDEPPTGTEETSTLNQSGKLYKLNNGKESGSIHKLTPQPQTGKTSSAFQSLCIAFQLLGIS